MKKIFKLLLCAVLSVSLIFSLVSCGSNPENETREVTENFMNAFTALNLKKAAAYVNTDTDLSELPEGAADIKNLFKNQLNEIPGSEIIGADNLMSLFDFIVDKFSEKLSYTIDSFSVSENGEYIYKITLKSIDLESIDGDYVAQEAQKLVMKHIENGAITDSTAEQDIFKIISDDLKLLLENVISDLDITESEIELIVTQINDKWLISYTDAVKDLINLPANILE